MIDLVKIVLNDDGEPDDPVWHWVENFGDGPRTFCGGQVFGDGEGSAVYKTKRVKRGGITCPDCLSQIREIKSIQL